MFESLEIGDSLLAVLPEVQEAVSLLGMDEALGPGLMLARADGLRVVGECEESLTDYESALAAGLEEDAAAGWIGLSLARLACGMREAALAAADSALALSPASPRGGLARAEALAADGRRAEALDALSGVVDAWSRADAGFAPAARARDLQRQLRAGAG